MIMIDWKKRAEVAEAEVARLRGLLANRHEWLCSTNNSIPLPCDCGALDFCTHEDLHSDGRCMNCDASPRQQGENP